MTQTTWIGVFVVLIYLKCVPSLKVIPERAIVTYLNPKYVHNGTAEVKRYGRKSGYFINMTGTNKMTLGNNVSVHMVFYEFLHNEYKRSFVEMHSKMCDMLKSEPYVGGAFASAGLVCPITVGYHRVMNISIPADDFPNLWPFEKCKVEASLALSSTNEVIAAAEIFVLFKQKPHSG